LASYLFQLIDSDGEAPNDIAEPDFLFDTQQDAVKSIIAGLDKAIAGSKDDADLMTRARAFARVAIDGLL
ncbi:MAG: AAA family ATPase, partial [Mesorhizobium sp.]